MTSFALPVQPSVPARRLWRAAQIAGVALTVLLLAALVLRPAAALQVLWDMVIPILPATFLVNPMLWRNVCPLATVNTLAGAGQAGGAVAADRLRAVWRIGMLLLLLLVPARRFLFNESGEALAITIVAVALVSLAAGYLLPRRAGFCNTLCPVLPVEKLYGQSPLLRVGSARCDSCTLCTQVGCIDLAGPKAVAQTIGPTRRGAFWLGSWFGAFAAAFPGFVVGYFTLENGAFDAAIVDYVHVGSYAFASWAIVAMLAVATRLPSWRLLPLLAAASAMLYYWFAAPRVAAAYGAPDAGPLAIRLAAVGLVSAWLWVAWRRSGRA